MDGDDLGIESGNPRRELAYAIGVLHRAPQLGPVDPHVGEAVDRLHGGVGQERDLVRGVDNSGGTGKGCVDVPVATERLARTLDRGQHRCSNRARIDRRPTLGRRPDLQRLCALHRRPGGLRQHGHTFAQLERAGQRLDTDNADDPGDAAGAGCIDRCDAMAEGWMHHRRVQHPGDPGVDAVDGLAGHDGDIVDAAHARSDQPVGTPAFHRHIGGNGQARRLAGE